MGCAMWDEWPGLTNRCFAYLEHCAQHAQPGALAAIFVQLKPEAQPPYSRTVHTSHPPNTHRVLQLLQHSRLDLRLLLEAPLVANDLERHATTRGVVQAAQHLCGWCVAWGD